MKRKKYLAMLLTAGMVMQTPMVVMAETVVVDTEEVVDYIGDVVDDTLEDNTAAVDVSNGGTANVTGNITACVVVEEDGGTTSEPAVSLEGEGSTANIYGDVKGMVSVHNDGTANIVGDVQDAYGSVSVEGENSTVNIDGNVTGYIDVGLFDGGGTLTITGNVTGGNVPGS